jgi:hypothetical protein
MTKEMSHLIPIYLNNFGAVQTSLEAPSIEFSTSTWREIKIKN